MRKFLLLITFVSLAFVQNCLTTPIGGGVFFTSTTQSMHVDGNGNLLTSAKIEKSGTSCSQSSIFFVSYIFYGAGNSIEEAAKAGNIKKIALVDRKSFAILPGIFYQDCVVVWGE